MTDPTEDEIQAQLAGEVLRGPRSFRGQRLAELSRGLRDLRYKIISPDDTGLFHDVALLSLLAQAHGDTDSVRLEKRRLLLAATDDVPAFRANVSVTIDALTDAEELEARALVDEILGLVSKAQVTLVEKKSVSAEKVAEVPSPMTTPSPSSPSPKKPAGRRPSSAGS